MFTFLLNCLIYLNTTNVMKEHQVGGALRVNVEISCTNIEFTAPGQTNQNFEESQDGMKTVVSDSN